MQVVPINPDQGGGPISPPDRRATALLGKRVGQLFRHLGQRPVADIIIIIITIRFFFLLLF